MATGRIVEWTGEKGYIVDENHKRFSLHKSQWKGKITEIKKGVAVSFQTQKGKNDEYAVNAKLFDENKLTMTTSPHKTHFTDKAAKPNTFPKEGKPDPNNAKYPNPYHFIALDTQNAVTDKPIWHDGKDSKDLLSGEMCFSLKALTPLLVGQWQYQAKDVANEEDGKCQLDFFDSIVKAKKGILEPLRLSDGRVVLSGTSIKGMVRSSLSGLLSPPMERVAERSYSYRPNAKFQKNEVFRKARPALIISATVTNIELLVLNTATSVCFVRSSAEKEFKKQRIQIAKDITAPVQKINNVEIQSGSHSDHVVYSDGNPSIKGFYFNYDGGIDGTGDLHRDFKRKQNQFGETYKHVWITKEEYDAANTADNKKSLQSEVISHYLETLKHFLSEDGLFASGYPGEEGNAKAHIKTILHRWEKDPKDLVGRLIYVELENGQITSFGHHYYYRWRYVDTIRTHNTDVRDILKPLPSEIVETNDPVKSVPPSHLSAARLLFGYTSHRETDIFKQDGTANIGTGTYQHLAGRIHINSAIEFVSDGKDDNRFLKQGVTIPLRPLSQPRPSSVEHYLQQPTGNDLKEKRHDSGKMFTYGDLPNCVSNCDESGELAGRKFYLHQPNAAKDNTCYQETNNEIIQSDQAMLARFISAPNTEFKFRLQFKDLRPWELGALLVILEPSTHLATVLKQLKTSLPQHEQDLQNLLDEIRKHPNSTYKNLPLFAHKIGHARPLGFGSVLLKCDELKFLGENTETKLPEIKMNESQTAKALTEFSQKLADTIKQSNSVKFLTQWCVIHQYAGRTRAAYRKWTLEKSAGNERVKETTTLNFHSTARSEHIAARRLPADKAKLSDQILKPLDFKIE
jgi:CRISPR-associated protein (TIGR03986 family)